MLCDQLYYQLSSSESVKNIKHLKNFQYAAFYHLGPKMTKMFECAFLRLYSVFNHQLTIKLRWDSVRLQHVAQPPHSPHL